VATGAPLTSARLVRTVPGRLLSAKNRKDYAMTYTFSYKHSFPFAITSTLLIVALIMATQYAYLSVVTDPQYLTVLNYPSKDN